MDTTCPWARLTAFGQAFDAFLPTAYALLPKRPAKKLLEPFDTGLFVGPPNGLPESRSYLHKKTLEALRAMPAHAGTAHASMALAAWCGRRNALLEEGLDVLAEVRRRIAESPLSAHLPSSFSLGVHGGVASPVVGMYRQFSSFPSTPTQGHDVADGAFAEVLRKAVVLAGDGDPDRWPRWFWIEQGSVYHPNDTTSVAVHAPNGPAAFAFLKAFHYLKLDPAQTTGWLAKVDATQQAWSDYLHMA